jgi:hypothetical protein
MSKTGCILLIMPNPFILLNLASTVVVVMRKLLITYLSLQLAQSVGVDHHAAKEELYYYMRTKDHETYTMLTEFMDHFYENVCKDKDDARPNR